MAPEKQPPAHAPLPSGPPKPKEEPPVDVPPQPLTEPCAVISMTHQQVSAGPQKPITRRSYCLSVIEHFKGLFARNVSVRVTVKVYVTRKQT